MMNDEGQDSKTVYSFAWIVFWSKYLSLALLELLSCSIYVCVYWLEIWKNKSWIIDKYECLSVSQHSIVEYDHE